MLSFGAAVYFTRAATRRVIGALAGGLAVAMIFFPLIALAKAQGSWTCPFLAKPVAPMLTFIGLADSYAAIALVMWRIERRFGWRGTAWTLAGITAIGAPRDYGFAAWDPGLMVFGPGAAPIAADAAAYFFTVALAIVVMRLISGLAVNDALARS